MAPSFGSPLTPRTRSRRIASGRAKFQELRRARSVQKPPEAASDPHKDESAGHESAGALLTGAGHLWAKLTGEPSAPAPTLAVEISSSDSAPAAEAGEGAAATERLEAELVVERAMRVAAEEARAAAEEARADAEAQLGAARNEIRVIRPLVV